MYENIRKVQLKIFDIFKEVVRVCEENDIEYFIVAGTLLGAVRHKGFIPWDDDLDIGMTRENYEKFISIAQEKLPENLFLQIYRTDKEIPAYFAKVRMDNTMLMEYCCRNLKMHQGIYIDIFPYDNIPDNKFIRKIHYYRCKFWFNLFIAKTLTGSSVPQTTFIGKIKLMIRWMMHQILRPFSKNKLFYRLDKVIKKYNKANCKQMAYVPDVTTIIDGKDIYDLKEIEFEDMVVKCPNNPKKQLEMEYGDYMKLPPENERVGHIPYKLEI